MADPKILFLITRIEVEADPAFLEDHEMTRSKRGAPTVRSKAGKRLEGLLIRNVSRQYTDRLNGYYGPDYKREELKVRYMGAIADAETYVATPEPKIGEGVIDGKGRLGDKEA